MAVTLRRRGFTENLGCPECWVRGFTWVSNYACHPHFVDGVLRQALLKAMPLRPPWGGEYKGKRFHCNSKKSRSFCWETNMLPLGHLGPQFPPETYQKLAHRIPLGLPIPPISIQQVQLCSYSSPLDLSRSPLAISSSCPSIHQILFFYYLMTSLLMCQIFHEILNNNSSLIYIVL